MMHVRYWTLTLVFAGAALATCALTSAAGAQGRGSYDVAERHVPPTGECRVWYDDRPPGRQPRSTDCATAQREARRTGGRVIYGVDRRADLPRREDTCDDRRRRTRDCDYAGRRYPSSLPEMVWAVSYARGRQVEGVRRWVGTGELRVKYSAVGRRRAPEMATWYDARGRTLQRWIDDDRDGRADRVAIYRDGRLTRVIR